MNKFEKIKTRENDEDLYFEWAENWGEEKILAKARELWNIDLNDSHAVLEAAEKADEQDKMRLTNLQQALKAKKHSAQLETAA